MINDRLHRWWGLSYSSWLTLPRTFLQEMPNDWQEKMAILLEEYDNTFTNQPELGTRVQVTDLGGKMVKTPEWLVNYRRPDKGMLNACKREEK